MKEVALLETLDRDEALFEGLTSLDESLKRRLVETSLTELPVSRRAAVDRRRVRERVFHVLEIQPVARARQRRIRSWHWVALGLAMIGGLAATVPNPVSAAIGKVFHVVPGLSTLQQTRAGERLMVLPTPVRGQYQGEPIDVLGVMVAPGEIMAEVTGQY